MSPAHSHLFLWSAADAVGLRRTVFPNLNVRWAFGFNGTQKCKQGMGIVAIVRSLRRGDNASFYCSWNPTSSNAKTSSLNKLDPIFTGHVLGTIGKSNTHIFLTTTHTTHDVVKEKSKFILHIVERVKFLPKPYVCWSRCVMLANLNFGIALSPCNGM